MARLRDGRYLGRWCFFLRPWILSEHGGVGGYTEGMDVCRRYPRCF